MIYVLFMQRRESYPGQYGPEVVCAIDEFCLDENPEGWEKQVEKGKKDNESDAAGFAMVKIEVDQAKIRRRRLGEFKPLEGKIK